MAQKPKGERAPRIEAETKAKVVIPDGDGRILILTRSPYASTRPNKPDLPGGGMDAGDGVRDKQTGEVQRDRFDLVRTIEREGTEEEMPGTVLDNIHYLDSKIAKRTEAGTLLIKTSVVLAATAEFPAGGIVLGEQEDGFEHVGAEWMMPEEALELDGLPGKYKRAIAASGRIIDELTGLQQDKRGQPPVPLSVQTVQALGAQGLLMGQEISLPAAPVHPQESDMVFRLQPVPAQA